jgi:acyl-CoA thioester hydrolase
MSAPFVHRLRVRYHECDAQGIVFNANHFAYFDVTLTELWRAAFGSYDAMVEAGTDAVVAEAQATFKGSPRFDDELDVEMTIARLGSTSMVSEFAERRDGEVLVTGRLVHVFVDPETMTKQEIPGHVRERLAPWVRSDEG